MGSTGKRKIGTKKISPGKLHDLPCLGDMLPRPRAGEAAVSETVSWADRVRGGGDERKIRTGEWVLCVCGRGGDDKTKKI